MKNRVLEIINNIRAKKEMEKLIDLSPDMSLGIDLGFDSLDLAQLTVLIEDEFGVDIFEEDIIETIGEIYECLERK